MKRKTNPNSDMQNKSFAYKTKVMELVISAVRILVLPKNIKETIFFFIKSKYCKLLYMLISFQRKLIQLFYLTVIAMLRKSATKKNWKHWCIRVHSQGTEKIPTAMLVLRKLTHSTRLSSPKGWDASTGLRPVISSNSTTPNENTSDFSVNFPVVAYSGAMYLNEDCLWRFKYEKLYICLTQIMMPKCNRLDFLSARAQILRNAKCSCQNEYSFWAALLCRKIMWLPNNSRLRQLVCLFFPCLSVSCLCNDDYQFFDTWTWKLYLIEFYNCCIPQITQFFIFVYVHFAKL